MLVTQILVKMQGCQQPSRQEFGVECEGVVLGYCSIQRAWKLEIQGVKMLLGHWWMMVQNIYIKQYMNSFADEVRYRRQ